MTGRPDWPNEPEAAITRARGADAEAPTLAPREAEALAQAVRPVAGRGRGATVAAVLIALAFVVGLVRPWDFLAAGDGTARPLPEASFAAGAGTPRPDSTGDAGAAPVATAADVAPTCGYPQGWRSATIQSWAGRRARVWSAVDMSQATDPHDPSIPFNVVAGDDFTAIGWCAPVSGDERPPVRAQGRLFRISATGAVEELAYRRLEPPASTSLGELWVPDGGPSHPTAQWPPGRYVIVLATVDGTWARSLGLELRRAPAVAPPETPSPLPSASGGGTPPGSGGPPGPEPSPQQTD